MAARALFGTQSCILRTAMLCQFQAGEQCNSHYNNSSSCPGHSYHFLRSELQPGLNCKSPSFPSVPNSCGLQRFKASLQRSARRNRKDPSPRKKYKMLCRNTQEKMIVSLNDVVKSELTTALCMIKQYRENCSSAEAQPGFHSFREGLKDCNITYAQ